jgi:IrrE N-terminal-like domain
VAADVIDQLVSKLLAGLGMDHSPPVDLAAVAEALGVSRIEVMPMTEEGRLEQRGGRASIWLRADAPIQRRRFTLAHELGHLVLADPDRDFTAHRMWSSPDREERFCDAFAASLLLPRGWIFAELSGKPENLTTLRELANATSASMSASLVRLRELLHWRCSLLYWRQADGQWALLYSAGVPRTIHNRVTSAPATRDAIGEIARRRTSEVTTIPLMIGGVQQRVRAEVASRGSAVLALTDLTVAASVATATPF